ncbi:MAG TPA: hypothetical protein VGG61_14100 [Gemmataceae bacterium]|jgi:hypothetical protein
MEYLIGNLVFGWVLRGRKPEGDPTLDGHGRVLRYTNRYRVLVRVPAAFLVCMTIILILFVPHAGVDLAIWAVVGGFWGLVAFRRSARRLSDIRVG